MEITPENLIYWIFIPIAVIVVSYYILWLIISSAVKKGVRDLANLMKKNLELKGVASEEIEKLCSNDEHNSKNA